LVSLSLLIPNILPFFTKWDRIADRQTIQTLYALGGGHNKINC